MADMTASPSPVPRPARTARIVLTGLVLAGLALLGAAVWSESTTPSGWFAYAPLSDTTYVPDRTPSLGTAALLSGAGALLLGGAAGFVVGRRSRPSATAPADGGRPGDVS